MKTVFAPRYVLALLALFALSVMPVFATPINVDTGKNLGLNPGASGTLSLSLTNENAGTAVTNFNSWGLILQLIPQPGATGSATFSSLVSPATNGALSDPGEPLLDPAYELSSPVNGTTGAYQLSIGNNSAAVTTFTLGQTYNIGDLSVQLSGNAAGAWNIYALNDANDTSSWLSQTGAATAFGNVATPGSGYTSTLIGTVSAVPEPSTLALLGGAVATSGWLAWRRRRPVTLIDA